MRLGQNTRQILHGGHECIEKSNASYDSGSLNLLKLADAASGLKVMLTSCQARIKAIPVSHVPLGRADTSLSRIFTLQHIRQQMSRSLGVRSHVHSHPAAHLSLSDDRYLTDTRNIRLGGPGSDNRLGRAALDSLFR